MANDTYSRTTVTPAFTVRVGATGGTTGTCLGTVIDTAGYRSNLFVMLAGLQSASVTSVTPVILSGTVTGTLASCAAAELIGTEALMAATFAGVQTAPGKAAKIGYIGPDRYIRADFIAVGAATGVYAGVWIQGDAIEPQ